MSAIEIDAWTDCPFTDLGDEPCTTAPIRAVRVIAYDRNKYCTVIVNGVRQSVKAGYLYIQPGRCGMVPAIPRFRLHALPKED